MNNRIPAILIWTIGFAAIEFVVWVHIVALWAYAAGGAIYFYEIVEWAFWGSMFAATMAGFVLGVCGILPATDRGDPAPS